MHMNYVRTCAMHECPAPPRKAGGTGKATYVRVRVHAWVGCFFFVFFFVMYDLT